MQVTVFRFLCLLGTCIVQSVQAAEPANNQKQAPQTTEELTRAIALVLEETNTPGAGIALVSRDEILLSTGIGLANRESKVPVTVDTIFRAGSISKSFTALAILKLQEAGQLKLEDRVRDLAPQAKFANPWEDSDPVRLVHLLEHTAGFDDISLRELVTSRPDSRLEDDINFDPRPRTSRWRPGQFSAYSNADYSLAGYVLEKVSGETFDDYLAEKIIRPLDMSGASFLLTDQVRKQLATGYVDGTTPRPYEHIIGRPKGALNCTPSELGHLVQMLLNRGTYHGTRVMSAASIERMETPTTSIAARRGIRDGYGLGNYSTSHKGYRIFGHAGSVNGYLARYAYSPEHGVGFALMLNADKFRALERCEKIILDYLARDWPQSPSLRSIALDEEQLARFQGFYEPHTLRVEKGRFLIRLLALQRVTVHDGALHLRGLLDRPATFLPGQMVGAFRRDKEPEPTILFFEDVGETYLASTNLRMGNLRRLPSWQFWGQLSGLLYCGTAMLSAIIFPLIWLPRKLLGYLRGVQYLSVRLLPSLAALSILGVFFVLFSLPSDPFNALGKPTVWSLGICALTWVFAALAVVGLVQVVRARSWNINRWVWWHSLLVSIANAIVLAYLAYWGIIGVRTWV